MAVVKFQKIGNTYSVRFRYDPVMVELIKLLPRHGRTWDADTKQWFVDARYAAEFARDLANAGHTVIGFEVATPPARPSGWAKALFTRVGPSRVDATFRAMTKVLHPDLQGGDAEMLRELIVAREELS